MVRRYKKVVEYPDELREFIKLINLLPDGLEAKLERLRVQYRIETHDIRIADIKQLYKTSSEYCEKLSQLVPAELKSKFIDRFTLTLEDVGFLGAHWELSKLVREKKTLKHIIQAYQHAKKKDLGIETNFAFGKPLDTFSFNSDSTFKMTGFQVIELLKKHKIPIKRLLECPVCLKIVWVKTTRAETCGEKKCSDELGNRKRLAAAKALKEKQDNHFKSRVEK